MRVEKHAQACLLLEGDGRILIDPGNLAVDAGVLDKVGTVDAVLWTHRHADHFDARLLDDLRARDVELVANADVASLLGEGPATVAEDRQPLEVAGFSIVPRDLPHCPMVDGSPGPPNTGYVIDGTFLHPGDAIDLDLAVADLAVPIAGPSISLRDAYRLVERTGARRAVAIHYEVFPADPHRFAAACDLANVEVLAEGESTRW